MTLTIALAGNPNVGKSTLFNALTGSRQHVGNWPGKTVEKKEGQFRVGERDVTLVDLPGAYSLTAYSIEEIITRDYIVNDHPDAVITVLDASNLERNLYLVTQILELQVPVIVALNMSDVARDRGLTIDRAALSARLGGIPVIEMVGNRRQGLDQLRAAVGEIGRNPFHALPQPTWDGPLADELAYLEQAISATPSLTERWHPHWLALKLLENDSVVLETLQQTGHNALVDRAVAAQARIETATGEDAETLIADGRYRFIGTLTDKVLKRPKQRLITRSDQIDRLITHRIWGLPIFLLLMWLVFQFTANVSAPFLDWVDGFINETVHGWATRLFEALGVAESWPAALITDGVIAGVGGVLVFVPVLLFLYLALAVLEDSGYMARAAFVMDRVMRWMGLHGKSFLPMIVGFGCTVPAVYATRTLENERDRKLTGFLATFMSCGARLPVYVVFGAAFFGAASGNLIFGMYLLGIGVALATGFALKHTVYKGQPPAPFVMELPPYRVPRPGDIWRQMWERVRGFVVKAGTVILAVSMVLWLLMALPGRPGAGSFNAVAPDESIFGVASGAIAPVFRPAGFGSWQASGSLITGFLAKEIIVGTMNQIYVGEGGETETETEGEASFGAELWEAVAGFGQAGVLTVQEVLNIVPRTINLLPGVDIGELAFFGEEEEENSTRLQAALVASFTQSAGSAEAGKVAALAFNVFVLLYVPCMAAVAAMRQEFGTRWMWLQIGYTLGLAWLGAVLVFQIGRLFL
jgi:ferrous iron transport protein B